MRIFRAALLAGVVALAALPQREARAQAACPIGAPVTVTTTTYTLTNNDQCQALVFTATSPITVTVPAPTVLAPGYQVMILPVLNGVTLSPASGTISNKSGIVIGAGQSGTLMGDGHTYWWGPGEGFVSSPAGVNNGTIGTNWSNSPTYSLPNGITQLTNRGSLDFNDPDAFAICRGGTKLKMGDPVGIQNTPRPGPSMWRVLDHLGRPWGIPLC